MDIPKLTINLEQDAMMNINFFIFVIIISY